MRVKCLHTLAEVAALRIPIDALNFASTRPDPFSTCEYYETLLRGWEAMNDTARPRVWFLAAFLDEELVGYLALKESTRKVLGCRVRTIDCLVEHDADRPHVVAKTEQADTVTEGFYVYLLGRKREWDLLELQQQDAASTLYPPPRAIHLKGCWVRRWPNMDNCTISIRWNTLPQYLKELSKKVRSNSQRQLRKLLASGNAEWLTSSDPLSTPALLELYCGIESRSWKAKTDLAIGTDSERLRHFQRLLNARQPLQIAIQILLLDSVPVAGLINGSFQGPTAKGLYALQIVFDDRFCSASPGSAILLLGIRHAIIGHYAFFNLLSGFGYYKERWLAQTTATHCVQIYRIGSIVFWRRLFGDVQRWLFARIPHHGSDSAQAFNPRRRGETDSAPEQSETGQKTDITSQERGNFAKLIAQAREGQCELLSAPELAETLLLFTEKSAAARPAKYHVISEATAARRIGAM